MTPDTSQLFIALNHVVRRRILRTLFEAEERLASPTQFAAALDMPLSNVNYHVTVLANMEALELVETRAVRGATEHFYRLALDGQGEWVCAALDASRDSDSESESGRD